MRTIESARIASEIPGACRDGYAVLREALPHALKLLADQATATDHVHT